MPRITIFYSFDKIMWWSTYINENKRNVKASFSGAFKFETPGQVFLILQTSKVLERYNIMDKHIVRSLVKDMTIYLEKFLYNKILITTSPVILDELS